MTTETANKEVTDTQIMSVAYTESTEIDSNRPQSAGNADSIVDQTPRQVLERPRQIRSATLTAVVGTPATNVIDPLQLLLTQTTISNYLRPFQAIRADIRIRVLVRSAMTIYGKTCVSFAYGANKLTNPTTDEAWYQVQSSMNCYLLDASTSQSLEFVIPYRSPKTYQPIRLTQNNANQYARVYISNWGTYNGTGGTASPAYDVYANFENVHVSMLTNDNQKNDIPITNFSNVEEQAMVANPQVRAATQAGALITAGAAAGGMALSIARDTFTSYFMPLVNTVSGAMIKEGAKGAMKSMASPQSATAQTSSKTTEDEAKQTVEHGGNTGVKQAFWGDLSSTKRNGTSAFIDAAFPQHPATFDLLDSTNPSLAQVVARPTYHSSFVFDSGSSVGDSHNMPINLSNTASYAAYYGRLGRYFRYTKRLKFHCCLPPLSSARIRLSLYYANTVNPDVSDDVPSQVHLINGTKTLTMDVPFVFLGPVVTSNTVIATVKFELLHPPLAPSDNVVTFPVFVTESHHDFHMYTLQDHHTTHQYSPGVVPPPPLTLPVIEEQSLTEEHTIGADTQMWGSTTSNNFPSYMTEIKDLRTIFMRYSSETPSASALYPVVTRIRTAQEFVDSTVQQYAANPFAFYFGSKELKIHLKTEPGTDPTLGVYLRPIRNDLTGFSENVGSGACLTDTSVWNFLDVTVPFVSEYPYSDSLVNIDTYSGSLLPVDLVPSNVNIDQTHYWMLSRAGPDFSVDFLNSLPPFELWSYN